MRVTIGRCFVAGVLAFGVADAALGPLDSLASISKPSPPSASTGNVGHVRGTSGVLEGTVNPHGLATTYYFQYGPTVAYGTQTTPATLPPGFVRIRVGQTVSALRLGEHYRIVATNADGTVFGRDRTFAPKSSVVGFVLPKENHAPPVPYGSTYVLRGSINGIGNTTHQLVLQSSPFPYLEPFATVTAPVLPSATGSFVLRLAHMTTSTQFRVATLDPRPLLSGVVTVHVSVNVTLKVRRFPGAKGFVRLYGTITPAEPGVKVAFQVLKAVRPGRSERETAFSTQFSTRAKRGTHSMSRFSFSTTVHRGGTYRALVELRKGALVSGASNTVHLSAAPGSSKPKKRR